MASLQNEWSFWIWKQIKVNENVLTRKSSAHFPLSAKLFQNLTKTKWYQLLASLIHSSIADSFLNHIKAIGLELPLLVFYQHKWECFFAIQIRVIISTQAVIILGRMIAHILFKKKERKEEEKLTVGFCNAVLSSVCMYFLIQLLSSNLLSYYFHSLWIQKVYICHVYNWRYSWSFSVLKLWECHKPNLTTIKRCRL